MNREELYEIAKDATGESELTSSEVPAIDLYVDQIINLVSDKQKQGSERFLERQLTKTMINNYSKDGLITPVKGKKYNKEQIIQILTVYTLKNTLSIGEIKRMLQGTYALEGFEGEDFIRLYDRYMSVKAENRAYTKEILDELMNRNELDISDEFGYMLTIGGLLSLSAFLRQTAQAMIERKYPPVEETEDKEKDKDKDKDKDKEKEKEKDKDKDKDKEKEKPKKEKKKKKEDEKDEESDAETDGAEA